MRRQGTRKMKLNWICFFAMVSLALGLTSTSLKAEGTWARKADMPTARASLCASVMDDIIYVIGGSRGWVDAVSTVEAYDPATDTWTPKADMQTPRSWFNTAVLDGKIYAIGGGIGNNRNTAAMEVYDPATDTWTQKANMKGVRGFMATCVSDGKIYAMGGWSTGPAVSKVEVYDPATDTWTRKANMPTARWGGVAVAADDGLIYVIGGERANATPDRSVEVYDPATDTWSVKPDMPHSVIGDGVYMDGRIYSLEFALRGGECSAGDGRVFSYDPSIEELRTETTMPTTRMNAAFAAVNGSLYVIGGRLRIGASGMAIVEQLAPERTTAAVLQGKLATSWGRLRAQ